MKNIYNVISTINTAIKHKKYHIFIKILKKHIKTLDILQSTGYLTYIYIKENSESIITILVKFKVDNMQLPLLKHIYVNTQPSRTVYTKKNINNIEKSFTKQTFIATTKGIISSNIAILNNIGGIVYFTIEL